MSSVRVAGSPGDGVTSVVGRFRSWLASLDTAGLTDREQVDLVAELERVKGAASAAQARATDAVRCSREMVAPQDVARSVGSMVALARRESPALGDRFVGLSRALVHEMPQTMAALTAGECSERVAVAVVTATATLSVEDRAEVDRRVGPLLGRLGVKAAGRAAARVAAELDAASVVRRMEAAVKGRRVTVRPAPDGMAYLSVLGPLKDVVGAYAAVQARSRAVVSGQCADEGPEGRGVGAVAADTALELLSGRAPGQVQPVEVHLVMTDRALLGTGDPDRSVFEPARIPGHGSVPAPVARAWLLDGVGEPVGPGEAAQPAAGPDAFDATSPARVWVRRLYTSPEGRDLVAMDSRRRLFGGLLRRMLVLRDDVCTTPWCEAPIVHADHTTPAREGSQTSYMEGAGKCARCNQGKEAPGWRHRVEVLQLDLPGDERQGSGHVRGSHTDTRPDRAMGQGRDVGRESSGRDRDDGPLGRRVVQVTTPLGHRYVSEPPPLLGWGSATPPSASDWLVPGEAASVAAEAKRGRPDEPASRGGPNSAPRAPTAASARRHRGSAPHRKRPLRRRERVRNQAPRRPRTTSHLERELCRYLT